MEDFIHKCIICGKGHISWFESTLCCLKVERPRRKRPMKEGKVICGRFVPAGWDENSARGFQYTAR